MRFLLLAVLLFSTGCSTTAIPMVIARRMNDRGETYEITREVAQVKSIEVLEKMGGEISWVEKSNMEERSDVHYSVADSRKIHGTFGILEEGIFQTETNFIVDINTVPNSWYNIFKRGNNLNKTNIRIGIGAWGNRELAELFHKNLREKLEFKEDCDR